MKKVRRAIRWLQFYWKAANSKGHGTHSPFVFEFITQVLDDTRYFYAYEEIETQRNKRVTNTRVNNSFSIKYDRLLFRMVCFYRPMTILQIGEPSAETTAYLAAANSNCLVTTVSEKSGMEPNDNLQGITFNNVSTIPNDDFLEQTRNGSQLKYDFILINNLDGVGELGVSILLSLIHCHTILVFNMTNKNEKNNRLLKEVSKHETTTLEVTLYEISLIFFKKEQLIKQQFAIRFY